MNLSIQRLGPGDAAMLDLLAQEEAEFDLDEDSGPGQPLNPEDSRRYLENPAVLFWVALEKTKVVGFLSGLLVPLRSGPGKELLLYEIGVRRAWRRRGVGRALLTHMADWMRMEHIEEVWVLADNPVAVEFYRSCGFRPESAQPAYMTRTLN